MLITHCKDELIEECKPKSGDILRTIDMQNFRELLDQKCTCNLSLLDADADLTASTDKFPGCVKGLSRNCPTHR